MATGRTTVWPSTRPRMPDILPQKAVGAAHPTRVRPPLCQRVPAIAEHIDPRVRSGEFRIKILPNFYPKLPASSAPGQSRASHARLWRGDHRTCSAKSPGESDRDTAEGEAGLSGGQGGPEQGWRCTALQSGRHTPSAESMDQIDPRLDNRRLALNVSLPPHTGPGSKER